MDANVKKVVGGLVLIVIALSMFPIVLDATGTILDDANLADYTGLESLVSIAPLIIFVGMIFSGGFFVFTGARTARKSKQSGGDASKYRY
ncbi:MAG: hypothetical protein PHV74_12465 [Dehalococcoidia bacterium]|nr:hypothetical protein [Dehalococcoidia bacterium]